MPCPLLLWQGGTICTPLPVAFGPLQIVEVSSFAQVTKSQTRQKTGFQQLVAGASSEAETCSAANWTLLHSFAPGISKDILWQGLQQSAKLRSTVDFIIIYPLRRVCLEY